MAKGGHNKKPTALKILEGNPGKRPLPTNEPKPIPLAPKCPAWLPKLAKRKWKELSPKLEALGLLTELDGEALATLCLHWALMIEASEDIKARGLLIPSVKDKTLIKNPSLQIFRDNSVAFDRYASHFGMDPQSRSRLSVSPAEKEIDGMEALFISAGINTKQQLKE